MLLHLKFKIQEKLKAKTFLQNYSLQAGPNVLGFRQFNTYDLEDSMKKLWLIPACCVLFTACNNDSGTAQNGDQNECDVPAEPSADWLITGKVKEAIMTDSSLSLRARFLSISTTDGVVTLSGTVLTQADVQEAERIAKTIEGVVSVKNQLQVKPPKA